MEGKFQINTDKELDAVNKIEKGNEYIRNARDKLSRIDIPDDFCYKDKLITHKGTLSDVIDNIKDFTNWLSHQIDAYNGITVPVTTSQNSKIVVRYEKQYLRETESGVEYYSPKSVEEVKTDWENLPEPLQMLLRFWDSYELGIATFLTFPVKLFLLFGSIADPGERGAKCAELFKELNMTEYKELITDMSGSNYMSDGIVRDILDASGNVVAKVTIYITIVGGVGEMAELGMIAHCETVKDGVVFTYEFAETMGDIADYGYLNENLDLNDVNVRDEIFNNAIESALFTSAIGMITNDIVDEVFTDVTLTTADELKNFFLRGIIGTADKTAETAITTAYKAKMTNQEFLELVESINPADIALYAFVYSPVSNKIDVFKDSKPFAQIEITD